MFTSKQIAIGIVAAAGLTAGASAYAFTSQQAPQKHQLRALGLGVMSVTPATREARVIVQCGDGQGELVTVKLPRRVNLAKLTPGATVGAVVLTPDNLVVKVTPAAPATCEGTNLEGAAASVTDTLPVDPPAGARDATGRDAGREHRERRIALLRDHHHSARERTPGRRGRRGPGRSSARPSATTSAPSRSTSTRSTCPPGT